MTSITFEAKDNLWISMRLIKLITSKLKGFHFHWIAYEFLSGLNFDNRIITGHVGENVCKIWIFFNVLEHFVYAVLCV